MCVCVCVFIGMLPSSEAEVLVSKQRTVATSAIGPRVQDWASAEVRDPLLHVSSCYRGNHRGRELWVGFPARCTRLSISISPAHLCQYPALTS